MRSRSKRRRRVRFSLSTRRRQRYHAKRSIRRHAGAVAPVCTFAFLIIHLLFLIRLLLLLLLYDCCSFTIFIRRLLASRSPTAFHCKQPPVLQTGPVARVATHVPAANASTAAIIIIIRRVRRLPSALTVSTHASVVPETFVALDWFRKVVTHLFDWSSLSSSFVISSVFVAFTTRSEHFSPQDYTTVTPITAPIRAEDDVSTRQHETMMNFLFLVRLFSNSIG